VCLHYLINLLQPLPWQRSVVVSLNPLREPRPETVLREFDYAHPVFDQAAVDAQRRLGQIQGQQRVWFCGAWTGYGFHEDGLRSGQDVAAALLQAGRLPQSPRALAA
jgi:predicted NAD/FAD-binding protein